jgi:hypothetical protein
VLTRWRRFCAPLMVYSIKTITLIFWLAWENPMMLPFGGLMKTGY